MTDQADRPRETAPAPPATTLAEARAVAVGDRYLLVEESFNLFDAAGFRPTFTWPALLFGFFWFVYRRMYLESVLIFLVGLILMNLSATAGSDAEGLVMLLSLGFSLVLAVTGRWLYWKAVDRRLEQAMRLYPHDPERALAWLKMKGGVAPWAVVSILLFIVLAAAWPHLKQ
jgi:hypothetical protein